MKTTLLNTCPGANLSLATTHGEHDAERQQVKVMFAKKWMDVTPDKLIGSVAKNKQAVL